MTQLHLDQIPAAPIYVPRPPSAQELAEQIAAANGVTVEKAKDWIVRAYFDLELPW